MPDAITARVDADTVVISDDNGASIEVANSARIRAIRDALDAAIVDGELRFVCPSAAALGALAEAAHAQPAETTIAAHAEMLPGGERIRVGAIGMPNPIDGVLRARASIRDVEPPTLADIAAVLVATARVRYWDEAPDGFQRTYRPVPSAGGRHPIELWLAARDVDGLAAGLWAFDATRCDLVAAGPVPQPVWDGVAAALQRDPTQPAVVLLVAQFDRTLSRYPAGASLVWRDAGATAATLHLCATAAGLRSTIVGTAGLLGRSGPGLRTDVGAVLIGR
jgi:SagB-type dehydrogenase family enzyme